MAFAAITLASLARDEAGLQWPRSYAHPVLELLARNQAVPSSAAHTASPRSITVRLSRAAAHGEVAGAWLAMLPVFFIGLVSPLNQLSLGSFLRMPGAPAAPPPFSCFQRPPPCSVA